MSVSRGLRVASSLGLVLGALWARWGGWGREGMGGGLGVCLGREGWAVVLGFVGPGGVGFVLWGPGGRGWLLSGDGETVEAIGAGGCEGVADGD